MPATITHSFFANDVYDVLPDKIKSKLNLKRCMMFSQSADSLIFYNLFSLFPGKDIREFSRFFHRNNSQDYFINLLNYIKDNNLDDTDTYSYLVGTITHYALDSTLHPYVYYKTGSFDKKNPSTYKYNNIHAFMEVFIDNDMISKRMKVNPYTFDIGNYCFDIRPFSNELENTINYTFYNTFKLRGMSKIYYKSLKQMKNALVLFRRDPHGIKRNIYKLVDTFTTKRTFRFEAVSYHYPLEDRHNFLNNNHRLWRNPIDFNLTSNESFIDLYLKALKLAKYLIMNSFDYLNNKNVDLTEIFTNKSYVTGLNCTDKRELKYFEF